MAPITRVYLDSNIFIYMFEANDDRAAALRAILLSEQKSDRPFFATSELTLAETLVGAYKKADENLISLYDNSTLSNLALEVGPIDRTVLWRAAILRADRSSLKLPDAIHLATAFSFNCSHFLTGDRRLGMSREFVDPRSWMGSRSKTIQIVTPEQSVLEEIRVSA